MHFNRWTHPLGMPVTVLAPDAPIGGGDFNLSLSYETKPRPLNQKFVFIARLKT